MNNRQRTALSRLKEKPTRSDITWHEIQSFFRSIGAEIHPGEGSRVQVILKSKVLRFHQPHPNKEMKKYAIEAIRDFLIKTEVIK
jgi:hypothetical protein